jgi:hypothetical protein
VILDIDRYSANKEFIQDYYRGHKDEPLTRMIALLSTSTMVPCVVVSYYVGEVAGWPEEVVDSIKRLTEFYDYDDILNKPEGSPV